MKSVNCPVAAPSLSLEMKRRGAHLRKLQIKLDYVFFESKMRPCDGQL